VNEGAAEQIERTVSPFLPRNIRAEHGIATISCSSVCPFICNVDVTYRFVLALLFFLYMMLLVRVFTVIINITCIFLILCFSLLRESGHADISGFYLFIRRSNVLLMWYLSKYFQLQPRPLRRPEELVILLDPLTNLISMIFCTSRPVSPAEFVVLFSLGDTSLQQINSV